MLTIEQELEIFEELKKIDTPTITNVIATYPANKETCLGLYHPWKGKWYTNQTMKCMYPELGRTVGYAVTCTYGLPDPGFKRLGIADVLRAIDRSPKPVILVVKQDFPEEIKRINGLMGGNMLTSFKAAGAVGVISDGPSRDVDEIRPMGIQYMLTGTVAGHGDFAPLQVGSPVEVADMAVATGEIIHMDENGAVKFPREMLPYIVDRAKAILAKEAKRQKMMREASDVEEIIKVMQGFYD